ncbi:hypothetical protein SAMN05421688_1239 [Poseidonocella pacifica]|uniref:Glycosyl transferase family 2 n=1 Tax=Poseidonocella pacifica TaxID=871651 RepID=A0A1I0WDI3_9RHOB|nr:hypothetical protein [Poseidonocella pacifica]SFA86043.1 hypothetical protein SAMN05421688_1239 [Poseidonocella pacifica]
MILSGSYNFFNGEEHLVASLRSVRGSFEHISLVWQGVSNSGVAISPSALEALSTARNLGLVDDFIEYMPDLSLPRRVNELAKRKLGLSAARRVRATHFMTLDADEFYREGEMLAARKFVLENRITSSSVGSFMHVARPQYRTQDLTNCAFITKITPFTRLGSKKRYPVAHVDSTRKIAVWPRRHHHFPVQEVAMFHMNLVRYDLENKLGNSSTTQTDFLDKVRSAVAAWKPGELLEFPGKGMLAFETVENEFETWDPGIQALSR